MAAVDPARPQIWAYTAALSYARGQTLRLHAMSLAASKIFAYAVDGNNHTLQHGRPKAPGCRAI